uniref:Uncharacterized protein n=1 Tax=Arundo donax TaxID=35708 RepID=A0A0A9A1J9_ARUDO
MLWSFPAPSLALLCCPWASYTAASASWRTSRPGLGPFRGAR